MAFWRTGLRGRNTCRWRAGGQRQPGVSSAGYAIERSTVGVSPTADGAIVCHPVCGAVGSQQVNALHCEVAADAARRPAATSLVGGVHRIAIGILQRQGLAGVV